MSESREVRCLMTGLEIEQRASPGRKYPGTLRGYAAVVGPLSEVLADDKGRAFREKLEPGAFARALEKCDARCLVNHDVNQLIGRMKAGTLRMTEDELGLRVECDLPDTQIGHDTAESIRRGDLDGMSFSFDLDEKDTSWDHGTEPSTRSIRSVSRIYDVGPVAFPAYQDTSVAMRSLDRSCQLSVASCQVREDGQTLPPDSLATDNRALATPDFPIPVSLTLSLAKARLRLAEANDPL